MGQMEQGAVNVDADEQAYQHEHEREALKRRIVVDIRHIPLTALTVEELFALNVFLGIKMNVDVHLTMGEAMEILLGKIDSFGRNSI